MTTHHLGRRRVLAAGTGLALVAALAGCSGDTSGSGTTTLRLLVHSNPPTDKALKELNKAFEAKYPDIEVQLSIVPTTQFPKAQQSRVRAGSVDLTEGASSGAGTQPNPGYVTGTQPPFVVGAQAGNWVDLSNERFMKNFSPDALEQLSTDGKQYSVPTGGVVYTGVFYNKEIFEEYGLEVPTTWAEFESVLKELKGKQGVTPVVFGGKDTWPAGLAMQGVVQSLYPSTEAMESMDEKLWKGEGDLTDPTSVKVLERVRTVFEAAGAQAAGTAETDATAAFAKGEAAMWPSGSWSAAAIDEAGPDIEYGYFPMPGSDDAADNRRLGGKLDFSFAIPASSPNQDAARKWLAFYAQKDTYRKFIDGTGFTPAQPGVSVSPFVDSLEPYLGPDGAIEPAWDQVFHSNPQAGQLSRYPWDFTSVAPLGESEDMTELAGEIQANWEESLPQ